MGQLRCWFGCTSGPDLTGQNLWGHVEAGGGF